MHNYYIINGVVAFHPATSTLRAFNDYDNAVVLNLPAGRCLLLLIERIGSVVTQREFMEIVWTKRGMEVSSNTFYQNICILRRGLRKVGLSNNTVITLPRTGLTLASGTHIKKLTPGQWREICRVNAFIFDEQSSEHEFETLEQFESAEPVNLFCRRQLGIILYTSALAAAALLGAVAVIIYSK